MTLHHSSMTPMRKLCWFTHSNYTLNGRYWVPFDIPLVGQ